MTLVHKEGVQETGLIRIKRGIFQGDSLSPLLITMSLNSLSWELQKTEYIYWLDEQTKINHLFYVNDLKLYGTSDNQLTGLINTVKMYWMTSRWNLDWTSVQRHHSREAKCWNWGNPTEWQPSDTRPGPSWNIQVPGDGGGRRTPTPQIKVNITNEYKRRIKLVLKSKLNSRNKIAASIQAVPVILYSYGVIGWKLDEIQSLDRITR